ncbi:hypothetical protein KO516_23110 [Citreicella sp. C3M06]|uniref:hypothetical protein n=1 Tax=Citreicella sp. C3M06 TaxID=2841564 RepID=UPI001C093209|nr:hypothetical protein [Citreicella sp. C3M06]MBU2963664.1 hypothetical protein [Citreicella sp. C3M06]
MHINAASSEALRIIESDYSGSSKPISINRRPGGAQRMDWWMSEGKTESISQDRKRSALRLYRHIASQTSIDLPLNTFPAAFAFNDQAHYRPDKWVIKALVRAGALEACHCEGELCFRLTNAGTYLLS